MVGVRVLSLDGPGGVGMTGFLAQAGFCLGELGTGGAAHPGRQLRRLHQFLHRARHLHQVGALATRTRRNGKRNRLSDFA